MKSKNRATTTTRLGMVMMATASLVLSGCGGGSSTSTSNGGANNGNVTAEVSCTTPNASGKAALDCLIAEMASTGGGRVVWYGAAASGVIPASASAYKYKLAATPTAGKYDFFQQSYHITSPSTTWQNAGTTSSLWGLTPTGWLLTTSTDPIVFQNNGDGTLTATSQYGSYTQASFVKTDLTNQTVACTGSNRTDVTLGSFICPIPMLYPSGASSYSDVRTNISDYYYLYDHKSWNSSSGFVPSVITDLSGATLTILPAIGSAACIDGVVYKPIIPAPAAGIDNYNVYVVSTMDCNAASITTALTGLSHTTALITPKTVHSNAMWLITTFGYTEIAAFNAQALNQFMVGYTTRAGTQTTRHYVNVIAANAQLAAHGLLALPNTNSVVPPANPPVSGTDQVYCNGGALSGSFGLSVSTPNYLDILGAATLQGTTVTLLPGASQTTVCGTAVGGGCYEALAGSQIVWSAAPVPGQNLSGVMTLVLSTGTFNVSISVPGADVIGSPYRISSVSSRVVVQ